MSTASANYEKRFRMRWIFLPIFLLLQAKAVYADGVIIGNGIDHIDKNQIKALYSGNTNVVDGVIVRLVDYKPLQEEFLEEIVGKSLRAYKKDWLQMLFADGAVIPILMQTPEDVMAYVKRTPNSIAYVSVVQKKGDNKNINILLEF